MLTKPPDREGNAPGAAAQAGSCANRKRLFAVWSLGAVQLGLWCVIALLAGRFTPGSEFGQRPMLAVVGLLAVSFVLYLAGLALVWNTPGDPKTARASLLPVLLFAVLFRLPLWWSQPIQEIDLYRYLWDGRVLATGLSPYRYSPAQVDFARDGRPGNADLDRLSALLERSPEISEIFSRIDHRSVPTIYPPLSQAVFAATALVTPERAPMLAQVRVLKGVLLLFDLATIGFIIGLLRNVGQQVTRVLAYAWCPLVLKEFANSGHLDSIAVCLTAATFWLLTRTARADCQAPHPDEPGSGTGILPVQWHADRLEALSHSRGGIRVEGGDARRSSGDLLSTPHRMEEKEHLAVDVRAPSAGDWLAAALWAGAVLAKLYPLVLAPVLLAYWWRRLRWQTSALVVVSAAIVLSGYMLLPRGSGAQTPQAMASEHSSFSGLGEFLHRWEMNDLLFSIVYENVRPRAAENGGHEPREMAEQSILRGEPWYSVLPATPRAWLNSRLAASADAFGLAESPSRLAFLFTQLLAAGGVLIIACGLALRRWPDDPREELSRRAFLCLAWLWFLSATQNPWYWTWALPFVVFASRPWLLVSGFALIYYLRFWFVYTFPEPTLPGGLTGRRFFDEVVVWVEHLPVLLLLAASLLGVQNWMRKPPART